MITGFGKVNGRVVFAAAQDFTSHGGSLGEMHARKIWKVMDMALAAGKPFVALNDSGGARIQEDVPSLEGYGGIFYRNSINSGYIPQLTTILGPSAGGADYVMAWPTAEIAVMGAEGACNIIYNREISGAADPGPKRQELIASYEEQFNNPYFAVALGAIDEIIIPRETRKRVVELLEAFKDKKESRPPKKHGNIPL